MCILDVLALVCVCVCVCCQVESQRVQAQLKCATSRTDNAGNTSSGSKGGCGWQPDRKFGSLSVTHQHAMSQARKAPVCLVKCWFLGNNRFLGNPFLVLLLFGQEVIPLKVPAHLAVSTRTGRPTSSFATP